MIDLAHDSLCTGCGACVEACPTGALARVEDDEGFMRPRFDAAKCKNCGRCSAVCAARRTDRGVPAVNHETAPAFFAARLCDESLLDDVSSGGASWALMCTTLARGGVVYGAAQVAVGEVRHLRAEDIETARALRRSKYLPSDMQGVYTAVQRDLDAGREVLFTGTPCQVAALNAFLGRPAPALTTCEVVCHGVPSLLAWRRYRAEKEAAAGKKIADLVFRDKSLGWKHNQYRIVYADGSQDCESSRTQLFHVGYLRGLFYRPSCSRCPYAAFPRVADLALADFWKYKGPLFSPQGVSLVVASTPRGRAHLAAAAPLLQVEQVTRKEALASCRNLSRPPEASPHRAAFMACLREQGYHAAARRFISFPPPKAAFPLRLCRKIAALLRAQRDPDGVRKRLRASSTALGLTPIFPATIFGLLRLVFGRPRNALVFTENRRVSAFARRRGFAVMARTVAQAQLFDALALRDAFRLLISKGVPVLFVDRVGLLDDPNWSYAPSARRRMADGLDFPTLYANPRAYEDDLRELFGDKYSPDYVQEIGRIPQIVHTGAVSRHEDCAHRLVTVVGGLRVTCGQPKDWKRTLHVYGRCGVFGYAVEDADTLPSRLQRELVARGQTDLRVVNHGLWGGDEASLNACFLQDVLTFKPGDIVLFYRKSPHPLILANWRTCGLRYYDITKAWHQDPAAKFCFYDRPGHMNAVGYGIAARLIAQKIPPTPIRPEPTTSASLATPWLMDALKRLATTTDFETEIAQYIDRIRALTPPLPEGQTAGAIVMNCNPFTNGHLQLVTQAARDVDRLYLFVVEEDKSSFTFAERMKMVKEGTAHLSNVVVVPSGRFIISTLTFPQYFLKDYVKEKNFDVSGDVRTFCERIAPPLGIRVRFAGEEPFDPVTATYNRSMAELLPLYGLRFHEIPRFATTAGDVISATTVRRLLEARDWVALSAYVPPSTLAVLRDHVSNS